MFTSGILSVILAAQAAPLPKLVGTLSVTAGKVRLERSGRDPEWAGKYVRVRIGDKLTVVEKPKATLRIDFSRETFRLPEKGAWLVQERSLKVLDGSAPTLIHRETPPRQAPGAKPPAMAGRIRGGEGSLMPMGTVASSPVTMSWSRAAGAKKSQVELLDAAGKKIWSKDAGSAVSMALPSDKLKPGTWFQVRVVQSGAGNPSVTSTWIRLLSGPDRTDLESSERSLRTALSEDPVALGEALGELWASAGMVSRLPEALKLISAGADWEKNPELLSKLGTWLESAGFTGAARTEYERAWAAGGREPELKESIERLGGKAELEEWEILAAERDRLMAEGKFKDALPVAERVMVILGMRKPRPEVLATAKQQYAKILTFLGNQSDAKVAWGETSTLWKSIHQLSYQLAQCYDYIGYLANAEGRQEEAQLNYEAAVSIYRELSPGNRAEAIARMNLGIVLDAQKQFKPAQRQLMAALNILLTLNPKSVDVIECLDQLANNAYRDQRLEDALKYKTTAIETAKSLNEDSTIIAGRHFELGLLANELRNAPESGRHFESALQIYRQIDPDSFETGQSILELGILNYRLNNFQNATDLLHKALQSLEGTDKSGLQIARCLLALGNLLADSGKLQEAHAHLKRSCSIYSERLPESLEHARALLWIGDLYRRMEWFEHATANLSESLRIIERRHPNNSLKSTVLTTLARVLREMGDLYQSRDMLLKCLELAPTGPSASILNNLATVSYEIGDISAASLYAQRALENSRGPESEAAARHTLGNVAFSLGELRLAELYFKEAYALRKAELPGLYEAVSNNTLAILDFTRGDYIAAQSKFLASIRIIERIEPGSEFHVSTILYLSATLRMLNELEESQRCIELAQLLLSRIARSSQSQAECFLQHSELKLALGEFEEALNAIQNAKLVLKEVIRSKEETFRYIQHESEILFRIDDSAGVVKSLTSQLEFLRRRVVTVSLFSSILDSSVGTDAQRSLSILGRLASPAPFYPHLPTLRAAGLTMQTRARISELAAEKDEEVRKARSAVQIATKQETDWATNPRPKEMDEKTWNDRLLDLRAKRQSAELKLATLLKEKDPRLASDLKVNLEDIQKNLAPDTALIEFLRVSTWDDKAKKPGPDAYAAFIVRSQGDVKYVRLGDAEETDALVEEWHVQIALANDPNASEAVQKETEKQLRALGRKLHDRLIKPLGRLPVNVMLAPDASLHSFPFAALVDGKGKFLVETKALSVVGSGRDLVEKPVTGPPGDIAVLAAPNFGADAQAVEAAGAKASEKIGTTRSFNARGTWDPLPSAAAEGDAVAKLLQVQPIEAAQATEERLLSLVRPRVLHIATHGFFFPPTVDRKDRNEMMMNEMIGGGLRVADNPMLRSGLILAGANNDAELRKAGLADGWATALEISLMDLRGTELVVLSACDTGRGQSVGSEGVFGLQRAFRFAGAQTLIVSLFKVPDDSTQALMAQFYDAWKPGAAGGTKLASLRAAQLTMLSKPTTRHPRHWAAFVLMGDR